jgi:hypothetical protein
MQLPQKFLEEVHIALKAEYEEVAAETCFRFVIALLRFM